MCSPATRGIWIDLICSIHELNRDGKLTANLRQMSRVCRCTEHEMSEALTELKTSRTADVYDENGVFTVTCRRIERSHSLSIARSQAGSKGAASTQAKREQNPDTDIEGEGLDRVREFSKGEGISQSDADWFYWKGKGNGWTNGGEPIRDWKATIRSWKRAGYLPSQKQSNNGQRQFQSKPKEAAPSYPKMTESREPTAEEREHWKKIGETEVAKLREQFKMP